MNRYDERQAGRDPNRDRERDRGEWSREWRGEGERRPGREWGGSFSEQQGSSGRYGEEGHGSAERYGEAGRERERYGQSGYGERGESDREYSQRGQGPQRSGESQPRYGRQDDDESERGYGPRAYGERAESDRGFGQRGYGRSGHAGEEGYGRRSFGSRRGERDELGTSGSGGSTYGASGYEPFRGEGQFERRHRGEPDYGRARWGEQGSGSQYSESQYSMPTGREEREQYGAGYGHSGYGAGYEASTGNWRRGSDRSEPEGYGSGADTGFRQRGRQGPQGRFDDDRRFSDDRSFGTGPFSDTGESPRYYGAGYYGDGGSSFTGGYDQRNRARDTLSSGRASGWQRTGEESRSSQPGGRQPLRHRTGPKGYTRSDDRLREDISERLMMADHIDSSEVTVNVKDGKVTLEGSVPSRYMKHAIEDLVDMCPGVQDIDNRLRVERESSHQGSQQEAQGGQHATGGTQQGTSHQRTTSGTGASGGASTGPATTGAGGSAGTGSMGTGTGSTGGTTGSGSERSRKQ